MLTYRVNVKSTVRLDLPRFSESQLQHFGEQAIEIMKDRISRGLNIYDCPAAPLSKGYLRVKQRAGRSSIRDLNLTGRLLASLKVSSVSERGVRIGFEGRENYIKAHQNQEREPMFGLSQEDRQKLIAEIRPEFSTITKAAVATGTIAAIGIAAWSARSMMASAPRSNVIMMTPRPGFTSSHGPAGRVYVMPVRRAA